MSAIANITIADGATTPVSHVFAPVQSTPVAVWQDTDSAKAYLASQFKFNVQTKRSTSTKGLTRVRIAMELPTMGTGVALPASEVDYSDTCIIEFLLPNRGLKQGRKDLRTLVRNLLADAQIIDVVDELRSAY